MHAGTSEPAISRTRETDECLRILLESAFEALAISIDGAIVVANQAFAHIVGYSRTELVGMTAGDLFTPDSALRTLDNIRHGVEVPYELVGVRKDGRLIPLEACARNVCYFDRAARLTTLRDTSEHKRAEAERQRSQTRSFVARKLEALGMLAGGMAHDFNNLLLVIVGHTELALRVAQEPQVQSSLRQIRVATQRASDLTRQLLTYAARRIPSLVSLQLSNLVRDVTESLPRLAGVQLDLAEALPAIDADPAMLKQLVTQLLDNAVDAVADNAGRVLVRTAIIHVDAVQLSQAYVDASPGPGELVLLEVADAGSGIDDESLEHIFDPFFSTKPSGAGLGLSVALGIVRTHRAALFVASERGLGSRFSLLFPPAGRRSQPRLVSELRAHGSALVVADDNDTRERGASLLERFGFDVLLAADGFQALAIVSQQPARLDMVLLDLTLPHMNGLEVLRAIREQRPGIVVILLGGLADQHNSLHDETTRFLPKPFDSLTLGECMRQLLTPRATA